MAAQRRRSDKLLERMKNNPRTTPERWRKSCHPPARLASESEHSRPSSDKVCLYSETCADD